MASRRTGAGFATQKGELAPQRDDVGMPLGVVAQQLRERLLGLEDLQASIRCGSGLEVATQPRLARLGARQTGLRLDQLVAQLLHLETIVLLVGQRAQRSCRRWPGAPPRVQLALVVGDLPVEKLLSVLDLLAAATEIAVQERLGQRLRDGLGARRIGIGEAEPQQMGLSFSTKFGCAGC